METEKKKRGRPPKHKAMEFEGMTYEGAINHALDQVVRADLDKCLEKFKLLIEAHGDNQCLVAVAQIDAAPLRCMIDIGFFRPAHGRILYVKILSVVLLIIFHDSSAFPKYCVKSA